MESMLDTLRRLRSYYGSTMDDDECATLVNDAAWIHRAEGYGVSNKDSGTHGHRKWDDEDICHDVLMLKDGTYWDALLQAGGKSEPVFDPDKPSGKITDPARYWIAPIEPGVSTGDPDIDESDPQKPPPPVISITREEVRAIVATEVARAIHEAGLFSEIVTLAKDLHDLINLTDQRITNAKNEVLAAVVGKPVTKCRLDTLPHRG